MRLVDGDTAIPADEAVSAVFLLAITDDSISPYVTNVAGTYRGSC